MKARAGVVVTALLVAGSVPRARADEAFRPKAALTVERGAGAEACPDANALGEAASGRLGYEPFVADGRARVDLVVRVRFARTAEGLTGKVEAFDPKGEPKGDKTIASKHSDCAEVAQAVTLTIAILLDPRSGLVKPPAETKPEPDPLAPEPPPPRDTPPPPSPSPSIVPRVRVGGVGSVGAEPAPSVAAVASVGLAMTRWAIDLELRADLPRDATANDRRVTTGLVLGAIAPCIRGGILEACAVVAAGALRTEAEKGSPSSDTSFHMAAGPRLGVVVPLSSMLALHLHGDLLVALTRTTLRVDGLEVWTAPIASGLLGASLEVRFP